LPARSCLIDGEAIACDENGLVVFDLLRRQRRGAPDVTLRAFNLLELDGQEDRKGTLEPLVRNGHPGIGYCPCFFPAGQTE
jgi:ATP-dependent DNA ligase